MSLSAPDSAKPKRPLWRRALGGAWALAALVVAGALGLLSLDDKLNAPWMEARAFYRTLARQGPDAAYDRAAPELRSAVDREGFRRIAAGAGLERVTGGGWNDRRFQAAAADMGGTLDLRGGGRLPNVTRLIRHGLRWKVSGLEVAGAPAIGPPAPGIDRSALGRPSLAYAGEPRRAPDIDAATGVPIAHPPALGAP